MSTDLQALNHQTLTLPSIHTQNPDEQFSDPVARPSGNGEDGSGGEFCRTPTSEKHRIPAALRCPPAPKKPRFSRSTSCRRKLSELDFFDVVNRREVDTFFELAAAAAAAGRVSKRRRPLVE
ncbi:cyclin-dependent protein kinase inhibitor SMR3-like [Rhodamnia argentea]|uniref:Cyclin-dependent protein kinase inhibitor SMR3-like n=1 Tax=Rhodamnia argentea TaxID=178133 RepID=A0A8B8QTX0_9MYRT|nr:cyclin-dependent protein kinase inhibitor SMR3-like [Rhodamnia argentea]